MTTYIVRRFLQSLLFILFMWMLVYTVLVLLMPGGPKYNYEHFGNFRFAGEMSGEELRQLYKLDQPWPLNFFL